MSFADDVRSALETIGLVRRSTPWGLTFALGAGVGAIAGATVALLVTPQTGAEARQKVGDTAKELAGRTSGMIEKARGTVKAATAKLTADAGGMSPGRNDVATG